MTKIARLAVGGQLSAESEPRSAAHPLAPWASPRAPLYVVEKLTASATLAARDAFILGDAVGGAITFTLPPATKSRIVLAKKIDPSANAVTLSGTIDGSSSVVLATQYDSAILVADGTQFWRVAFLNTLQNTGWSVSNVTTDKVFDANATTLGEMADVLGSLINALKSYGILGA